MEQSEPIAAAAKQIVEANHRGSLIAVIQKLSNRCEVGVDCEPADVLVSETFGDDPFAERFLPTLLDARARLLKPGARVVPSAIEVSAVLVESEALWTLSGRGGAWLGSRLCRFSLREDEVASRRLSAPITVMEVDFETVESAKLKVVCSVP